MRIAPIGTTAHVGLRVRVAALRRGHQVTAGVREASSLSCAAALAHAARNPTERIRMVLAVTTELAAPRHTVVRFTRGC